MPMSAEERYRLETEVRVGSRMAMMIEDEAMQTHLNGLLHGYQNMWLDEADPKKREELWYQAGALKALIESMQSVINTGKMAAQQLEQEKEYERTTGRKPFSEGA